MRGYSRVRKAANISLILGVSPHNQVSACFRFLKDKLFEILYFLDKIHIITFNLKNLIQSFLKIRYLYRFFSLFSSVSEINFSERH